MSLSIYQQEWERQRARADIPAGHLPVHRWYLRLERPQDQSLPEPPRDGLKIMRAFNPTVSFYRFLYYHAGEEYLWADRRRMSDADLLTRIRPETIHVNVLYDRGTPAGFFELDLADERSTNLNYFALMPGFTGGGLGSWLLGTAIHMAGQLSSGVMTVDTCTLDHPIALHNYIRRGFDIVREEDETYPDPRLDGTIPRGAARHVPLAKEG